MSTALTTLTKNMAQRFSLGDANGQEIISTLKATAFKGQVTDAQMTALLLVAQQYGLNPWTKEIYAFPDRQNGIVPVVGVDGWSRIINENPQFDGIDFEQDDDSCTCIIYRKDRAHPVKVTEWMSECKRGTTGPWQTHPKRMLRHKSLIQCARLAFGFVGIYDQDEAERLLEVEPPQGRVSGTQAAQAVRPSAEIDPDVVEARTKLVSDLEAVASSNGLFAYGEVWKTLTKQQRNMVGAIEHERLKGIANGCDKKVIDVKDFAEEPQYE